MNQRRWETRWQTLPKEMVEEIILRLPPKEVGKLRQLSKAWNSRLSSPKFVRNHSKFHMNCGGPEILIFDNERFNSIFTLPAAGGNVKEVSSTLFGNDVWHASAKASCHGLVVVEIEIEVDEEKEKRMLLFNPTTKEVMEIPPFKSLTPNEITYFLSLGYDDSKDNYKVVRLSKSTDCHETFVDVYSVEKKAWKNLGKCSYDLIDSNHGGFVNGCLHWFSCDKDSYTIVAFDLAKEEFKEVPSPRTSEKRFDTSSKECSDDDSEEGFERGCDDNFEECSDHDSEEGFEEKGSNDSFEECSDHEGFEEEEEGSDDSSKEDFDHRPEQSFNIEDFVEGSEQSFEGFNIDSEVAVLGGRYLVVMTNPLGKKYIEIWAMLEYGVQKSWKKLVIDNDQGRDSDHDDDDDESDEDTGVFRYVCVSGKDKLIFRKYCSDETSFPFLEYSLSTGWWEDVAARGDLEDDIEVRPIASVVTFRECLLSPNLLLDLDQE